MDNKNIVIASLLAVILVMSIVVIILLFKTTSNNTNDAIEGLEGLWITDEKFAVKAGIDGMIIYLGVPENKNIPACIIVHADNKTLLYKNFNIEYKVSRATSKKINFKITVTDNESDETDENDSINDVFPENILMRYYPYKSQLLIYEMIDDKKYVYADLVKDIVSTL